MITIKTPEEIQLMREAGRVVYDTLCLVEEHVRPGVTTWELNHLADEYIRKCGAKPSFLHYNGYPFSICASVNDAIVHGFPNKRRLEEGDIVSIDVGSCLKGYQGDAARTFPVGQISPEAQKLIDVTRECFFEALKVAKENMRIGDIGAAVQTHAESHGYSVVRELVGHGIGKHMHEPPDVPNFGNAGRGLRLVTGMCIAIEPMINAGKRHVCQLDDGWTIVTADGKLSAHYENTIAIVGDTPQILTMPEESL